MVNGQSGTELVPTHGPSPSWCSSLLWLNVLFAGNWGWRHRESFYLPYHEPAVVTEWQGHTCSFLLGTKPLWHWRKWKSGPTSKRDPRPRYRSTGKCPIYRYEETIGQLLHSEVGSNQVGCSCTYKKNPSKTVDATEQTRFSKPRSNDLDDKGQGQGSSHATHLLMLVIICTKYGKNPSGTVDATERTQFSRPRPKDLEDIGQGQRSLYASHPLILVIICAKYGKNPSRTVDFLTRDTPSNDSDHLRQI